MQKQILKKKSSNSSSAAFGIGVSAIIVSIVSVAAVSAVRESPMDMESVIEFFLSEQPIDEKLITLTKISSIIKIAHLFIYIL